MILLVCEHPDSLTTIHHHHRADGYLLSKAINHSLTA